MLRSVSYYQYSVTEMLLEYTTGLKVQCEESADKSTWFPLETMGS